MAPIKFEENIKHKLDKRTLSPSAEGWSKLSERLDADQKKSRNPIFWWLSIAAGIIIMIAVSVQFFNKGEVEEMIPTVVEDNTIKSNQTKDKLEINIPKLEEVNSNELAEENELVKKQNNKTPIINKAQIIDYKKVTTNRPKTEEKLAEKKSSLENSSNGINQDKLNKEVENLLNEATMQNAVTDVLKNTKTQQLIVTDREVDSLLKVANKALLKDKLKKNTIKTVDASKLLESVEEDMGQSFRSKVFNALKDSYKTVKTKVVERNN